MLVTVVVGLFFYFLFLWLFRILAIVVIAKLLSVLKQEVTKKIMGEGGASGDIGKGKESESV